MATINDGLLRGPPAGPGRGNGAGSPCVQAAPAAGTPRQHGQADPRAIAGGWANNMLSGGQPRGDVDAAGRYGGYQGRSTGLRRHID